VLSVIDEILSLFGQEFKIFVNHRGILNVIVQAAGIPNEKFKGVCSVIDQLDKISAEEVVQKLIT